jgi:hypothetical protein
VRFTALDDNCVTADVFALMRYGDKQAPDGTYAQQFDAYERSTEVQEKRAFAHRHVRARYREVLRPVLEGINTQGHALRLCLLIRIVLPGFNAAATLSGFRLAVLAIGHFGASAKIAGPDRRSIPAQWYLLVRSGNRDA